MSNIRTYEISHSEQKPLPIKPKDTTDYLLGGSLVMKNGKIDKVLFDGGYAQATAATSTTDKFAFNYYNQDHLGNNREVVDASGAVTQVTNYYSFGAPYADASASKGSDVQPYKYNGKELDLMHGLNTYDYGARQHDPILARWDRIDPLCEKYYSTSPYAYCVNNPVRQIDPNGMASTDFYDENGRHIGTDNIDNNQRVVVQNSSDVANVQNQMANTGTVDASQISSGVTLPADDILNESLNVNDQGNARGGGQEVALDMYTNGQNEPAVGKEVDMNTFDATAAPRIRTDCGPLRATIHYHPFKWKSINGGGAIYTSATRASGYDTEKFKNSPVNIIVGYGARLADRIVNKTQDNIFALYDNSGSKTPIFTMRITALKKIMGSRL